MKDYLLLFKSNRNRLHEWFDTEEELYSFIELHRLHQWQAFHGLHKPELIAQSKDVNVFS